MEQQTTFIPDGMNAFERNVKRVGDCMIAGILMIIFLHYFSLLYSCETGRWWSGYLQAGTYRTFRTSVLYL